MVVFAGQEGYFDMQKAEIEAQHAFRNGTFDSRERITSGLEKL
jgi:hypothetical protein